MKKSVLCIIGFLGLALLMGSKESSCNVVNPEQNAAIENAILKTHDKIVAAAGNRNAEEMFSYIAENDKGCIIQDGQLIMSRQEALDITKRNFGSVKTLDYQFDQRHVKVLCPTIAILTAAGKTTITLSDGRSFTMPFANSSIFVLQDGTWKIIHGHHSIPNPD